MNIDFQEILKELEFRVPTGIIDLNEESQVTTLVEILRENGVEDPNEIAQKARVYFSYINEAATKAKPKKKTAGGKEDIDTILDKTFKNPDTKNLVKVRSALGYDKTSAAYNIAKRMFNKAGFDEKDIDMVDAGPEDEEIPTNVFGKKGGKKVFGTDKKPAENKIELNKPTQSEIKYASDDGVEQVRSKDSNSWIKWRQGKLKAPGNDGGAFNEIGGIEVAGILKSNPNITDEEIEKILKKDANKYPLTRKESVSGGDKMTAAIQTGRAIYRESCRIADEMGYNPKKTEMVGFWGSEDSKENGINHLRDIAEKHPGITFNGLSLDEYERIIRTGGGGEDPTDTFMVIHDGSNKDVTILHISNKIASDNIMGNSTVMYTFTRIGGVVRKMIKNPKNIGKATRIIKENQLEAAKLKQKQLEYQKSFIPKYSQLVKDKKVLKSLAFDIYDDKKETGKVRRGAEIDKAFTSKGSIGKACKGGKQKDESGNEVVKKPFQPVGSDKKSICNLIDNRKATPEQKVKALFEYYTAAQKEGRKDIQPPAFVREIVSRLDDKKNNKGDGPKYNVGYDDSTINKLYGKMNDRVEIMRQSLNKLEKGLGDRALSQDFADRMHWTITEGHRPNNIPPDRFLLIMGNNMSDIWYDKDGQAYEKKKDQYYKVNDDGSTDKKPSEIKSKDVTRGNIATIGDLDNFQKCLGVPKGKTLADYMNVKYDKIDTKTGIQKVHIFDIDGKEVGWMSVRSKAGPGGDPSDTIFLGKPMQNCLQKQEYLKRRNKKK